MIETDYNELAVPNENTVVMLAELCNDDLELKTDAKFIADLGKLITNSETSTRFSPYLNTFKKHYVKARRSVKKRMQIALPQDGMEENESEGEDGDENRNAFNMFE